MLASAHSIGVMGASPIAATLTDLYHFHSGHEFAAWLGMTPQQHASGGKERIGSISKCGDKYIRSLLIAGAMSVLRHARKLTTKDME